MKLDVSLTPEFQRVVLLLMHEFLFFCSFLHYTVPDTKEVVGLVPATDSSVRVRLAVINASYICKTSSLAQATCRRAEKSIFLGGA